MGMFAFRLQREELARRAAAAEAEKAKASAVEVHELPATNAPVEVVAEIGKAEEAPKPRRGRRAKAQAEADKLELGLRD